MGDKEKSRSSFLYSLLAGLLKNRPLLILRQVSESNGLEAYRQLLSSLEPVSRNRSLGVFNVILGWSSFDMQKNMLSQLVKLEDAFREYEKTGATLAEEIKFPVLMKCLSGNIKIWLQPQASEITSYVTLREEVLEFGILLGLT